MSTAYETIITKLKELDLKELASLQERIATELRQKIEQINSGTSTSTTPVTSLPIRAKSTTIEKLKAEMKTYVSRQLTPEEIQENLDRQKRMQKVWEEQSHYLQGEVDAVKLVREGRDRDEYTNPQH
jgi:hypothetical protein